MSAGHARTRWATKGIAKPSGGHHQVGCGVWALCLQDHEAHRRGGGARVAGQSLFQFAYGLLNGLEKGVVRFAVAGGGVAQQKFV